MTADGSEDSKITPEGLPDYRIPPPTDYLPVDIATPTPNQPMDAGNTSLESENTENEPVEEDESAMESPEDDGDEMEDFGQVPCKI